MARDPKSTPSGVASVLTSVLARIDPERRILLWQKWNEAVGEPIASRARPQNLVDGVLVLAVDNHTWAQELQLMRADLVARINRALGAELVREIQIVNADGEPAASAQRGARRRR